MLDTIFVNASSVILSISELNPSIANSIIIETTKSYEIYDLNLNLLLKEDILITDIHTNPFYPDQYTYLTNEGLCVVNNKSFTFSSAGYFGFDFYFSPFVLMLYNSKSVALKDVRQDKENIVHTGNNISQVLPIDCCYYFAINKSDVEIYDCRYMNIVNKYEHSFDCESSFLTQLPKRNLMYKEGCVSQNHQSLYGISKYIEKFSHKEQDYLHELVSELGPGPIKYGKICNSIGSMPLYPLLAACFISVKNQEIWVQSSINGGLFIESDKQMESFANVLFNQKLENTPAIDSVKFCDARQFLQNLIEEELIIPSSEKPILPFSSEPDFEDFEDER